MNFSKSSNLALWLIFLALVAPYIFNNNFKSNFSIQNKSNKELKKENKLQEQNDLISIKESPQKNRYEFK